MTSGGIAKRASAGGANEPVSLEVARVSRPCHAGLCNPESGHGESSEAFNKFEHGFGGFFPGEGTATRETCFGTPCVAAVESTRRSPVRSLGIARLSSNRAALSSDAVANTIDESCAVEAWSSIASPTLPTRNRSFSARRPSKVSYAPTAPSRNEARSVK